MIAPVAAITKINQHQKQTLLLCAGTNRYYIGEPRLPIHRACDDNHDYPLEQHLFVPSQRAPTHTCACLADDLCLCHHNLPPIAMLAADRQPPAAPLAHGGSRFAVSYTGRHPPLTQSMENHVRSCLYDAPFCSFCCLFFARVPCPLPAASRRTSTARRARTTRLRRLLYHHPLSNTHVAPRGTNTNTMGPYPTAASTARYDKRSRRSPQKDADTTDHAHQLPLAHGCVGAPTEPRACSPALSQHGWDRVPPLRPRASHDC